MFYDFEWLLILAFAGDAYKLIKKIVGEGHRRQAKGACKSKNFSLESNT
jgi:hypothetical protein